MIVRNVDFKAMQKTLRNLGAPVYIKCVNRHGKMAFVRRPSCTPKQVENFYNVFIFFGKINEQNDTSTNNQRNVNEQC